MPSPKRKTVSEQVMKAVAEALTAIENDPTAPRTKRHIEGLAGLSHDAVARAFAYDRDGHDTQFKLTERFVALTAPLAARGDSLESAKARDDRKTIKELRQTNRELAAQLDRYATALFAKELERLDSRPSTDVVTPIRRTERTD